MDINWLLHCKSYSVVSMASLVLGARCSGPARSSANESNFEGEELAGYLPEVPDIFLGGNADDEEPFVDDEEGDDVAGSSGGPTGSDPGKTSPIVGLDTTFKYYLSCVAGIAFSSLHAR